MKSELQSKAELRRILRSKRKSLPDKDFSDRKICSNFLNSELYAKANCIYAYSSLEDEINTHGIIKKALGDKKRVALPLCIDKSGHMEFYFINSDDDLLSGMYGIKEPDTSKCSRADYDAENALVLVPGISFDLFGFRLGYGKGYYDRFLKKFTNISVGLCYNTLVANELPKSDYDIPVDFLITETKEIRCTHGGKNG